jgi:nucleoside-diphosphate-sugar epimerase
VPATQADIGKARRLLGWSPEVSLEEGLRECVEWYRRERSWASQIATPD